MHRDDKSEFPVTSVVVERQDGTSQTLPAVVNQVKNAKLANNQRLADVIDRKSTRPYRSDIEYVDLVVRDRFDLMGYARETYSISAIMAGGIGAALLASPFREVYWITVLEGPVGNQVYRPLRTLMMYEMFHLFMGGIASWMDDVDILTSKDISSLFCDFANKSGVDCSLWDDGADAEYAVHKGAAIRLGDRGTIMRDSRYPSPPAARLRRPGSNDHRLTSEEWVAADEFSSRHQLLCELYLDAEENAMLTYPAVTQARLLKIGELDDDTEKTPS
jgi:hypothetical protein